MYDATEAAMRVTVDACAKLKADNPNLRIYVVKYQKQLQYKNKISNLISNFNYDYIDSCATTADDGTAYVYDVNANHYKKGSGTANTATATAEANLAKALADIAADIKSWTGYKAAKNIR
jgi:hypothetical protein